MAVLFFAHLPWGLLAQTIPQKHSQCCSSTHAMDHSKNKLLLTGTNISSY